MGALEYALPDAWGRRILQARHTIDVGRENDIALLLLTGWAEPGAIGFAASPAIPERSVVPVELEMMNQALAASESFEKDGGKTGLPDFFVSGGSSAGGARPKVLARSGEREYLVKFPSITDPDQNLVARLEFFGLSCAREAGVEVPDFFLLNPAENRTALAVHRFDLAESRGRRHFLSFQSLIGIEAQLGLPYATMAEIIRKVSVTPEHDIKTLFKQMVVNVILCNCDDHLKNFSMLYSQARDGFRLTPAYDIVPNLWQREHILSVGGKTENITPGDLLREGERFGLTRQRCLRCLHKSANGVAKSLADNTTMLNSLGATSPLAHQLLADIRQNLAMLNKSRSS